jgi:hypothetical protein
MMQARPSFRMTVLAVVQKAGIRGIEREQLMCQFSDQPRVKITIALNELATQRKIYFRQGIYRAWDPTIKIG